MNTALAKTPTHPIEKINAMLEQRDHELRRALPSHIAVERFKRCVVTSCSINTELVAVDRQSLWLACMQAAQDGLLPDRKEGVIVAYHDNNPKSRTYGQQTAQWQPMISGILKRFRNSGQFKSITANIVREGEEFAYWIDELGEHMRHVPGDSTAKPVKAYAQALTKDGGSMIKVMTVAEINKRRAVSRAKDGPMWKEWWDEAAQKTVLRNLAKRLPSSSDLDDLMRRDDDEDTFAQHPPSAIGPIVIEEAPEPAESDPAPSSEESAAERQAFEAGAEACRLGTQRRAMPGLYREADADHLAHAWWNGWDHAKAETDQRS